MKKMILLGVIVFIALIAVNTCQAATNISLNEAPELAIYQYEFDKLVLDFTITADSSDNLQALTIINTETARDGFEIIKVVLWQDDGDGLWEGMGKDYRLANAAFSNANNYWYWQNVPIALTGETRFFVSIETNFSNYIYQDTSVRMKIPALEDNNANGQFDLGDRGVFLSSQNNGPSTDLINEKAQLITERGGDGSLPVAVITEPQDGETLLADDFIIEGLARDQGESNVSEVKIYINDQLKGEAASLDANYATWEYNWQNISPGDYNIKVYVKDGYSNFDPAADEINITISHQIFSAQNSYATTTDHIVVSDGKDKELITVYVLDQDSQPIEGKAITVNKSANININLLAELTDSAGKIKFEATCTKIGTEVIDVLVDGQKIDSVTLGCVLDNAVSPYSPGDLIKASGASVYYYANDGKRYVFPNEKTYATWYADFSTVKIITDEELASITIGGNVTYKPGVKMVKILTDPKVYAVGQNGKLHWLTSEGLANSLYGANWASLVEDVPDSFFTNYTVSTSITTPEDFNVTELLNTITTINIDKNL